MYYKYLENRKMTLYNEREHRESCSRFLVEVTK